MKPLNKKNYGSIPHLLGSKLGQTDKYVHEGQHNILTSKTRDKHDYIIVTEKYDGTNVGIAKVNGKIIAITRSGYLAETSPYEQHHYFAKWVDRQKDRFYFIDEGERLTGEWMLQAHGTKYKILDEPFLVFDYFNRDNIRLNRFDFHVKTCGSGLHKPRIIYSGNCAIGIGNALNLLNQKPDGRFISEKPEGLVYRVERNGKFDFAAKYVRNDFEPGKYLNLEKPIYNINPDEL